MSINAVIKLKKQKWIIPHLERQALGGLTYWMTPFKSHSCYNVCPGIATSLLFSRHNRCSSQQAIQHLAINIDRPHSVKLYSLQYF